MPQFVASGASHPALTILMLDIVFAGLTFLIKGPVALFAGSLAAWFRSSSSVLVWINRCSGAVMVGLAMRLALSSRDT